MSQVIRSILPYFETRRLWTTKFANLQNFLFFLKVDNLNSREAICTILVYLGSLRSPLSKMGFIDELQCYFIITWLQKGKFDLTLNLKWTFFSIEPHFTGVNPSSLIYSSIKYLFLSLQNKPSSVKKGCRLHF